MLSILKLLLPALLPSWRFFDVIAPSPRIHYTFIENKDDTPSEWVEFRPRPARLSFPVMLKRMMWNPEWNESLFMVSCAERIMEAPTQHSEDEILKRIINDLEPSDLNASGYIQFRLMVIERVEGELEQQLVFESRIEPLQQWLRVSNQ